MGQIAWSSCVEGKIGVGTKVWRWSHISAGAIVGKNCMIGAHCFIGKNVTIADNVRIQNGVFIPEGWSIGNDVFIGPHTVFINHPSMIGGKEEWAEGIVEYGAKIGAQCTIFPSIIGNNSIIGARSLVLYSIPEGSIYYDEHHSRLRV